MIPRRLCGHQRVHVFYWSPVIISDLTGRANTQRVCSASGWLCNVLERKEEDGECGVYVWIQLLTLRRQEIQFCFQSQDGLSWR